MLERLQQQLLHCAGAIVTPVVGTRRRSNRHCPDSADCAAAARFWYIAQCRFLRSAARRSPAFWLGETATVLAYQMLVLALACGRPTI